ncbi:MAG: FAD-dependent oxidoreductase [Chitinophagaceae bacterium]
MVSARNIQQANKIIMNLSSGYPFWLVKNGLPYDYEKLERSISTDVVILGGGISGALAAYYLVTAGIACVLTDARTIGLGSSCASTSLLQYEIDTPLSELKDKTGIKNAVRAYQLCSDAIDKLGAIAAKIKFDDFEYRNSLYYAAYKKDVAFIKKEFAIRKENGFTVEYLPEDGIKRKFGIAAPAAILSEQGGQTNAYAFAHAIHQYTKKKGLRIFDRTKIDTVRHHKKGMILKTETGYTIKAKKIIYATGYEALKLIDKKIAELKSTYATISEQENTRTPFWKDDALIWNTADPYLYMRTTKDKRILVGGRDEAFYDPLKRDGLIKSKTRQLVKDFNHVFPGIGFKPEFSWTGTFAATKDGLPYIGRYKKMTGSFFALGFGGNGITFSQIAAEIIRDEIKGKKNKDAAIFSFER